MELSSDEDVTVQLLAGGATVAESYVIPSVDELGYSYTVFASHFNYGVCIANGIGKRLIMFDN